MQQHDRVTVADLIQALRMMPPGDQVVLSSDPEGNGFHPLGEVEADPCWFEPDRREVSPKPAPGAVACRVLWPGY